MVKQRSRSRYSRKQYRNLKGGFIRSGTPQFSNYDAPNPLNQYASVNALNGSCYNCQTGGVHKLSRKKSRNQKKY
jgi:hypothetical protein